MKTPQPETFPCPATGNSCDSPLYCVKRAGEAGMAAVDALTRSEVPESIKQVVESSDCSLERIAKAQELAQDESATEHERQLAGGLAGVIQSVRRNPVYTELLTSGD